MYEHDVEAVLEEGEKSLTLPSGVSAQEVPNIIYLQDDAIDETDNWRYTLDRVSSEAVRVVTLTGRPQRFSSLTLETLDFDAIADRDYRLFFKALKQMTEFTVSTTEIDYPRKFLDYLVSYASYLYYVETGMLDQAQLHMQEALSSRQHILVQEHNTRPYRYHKDSYPTKTPLLYWSRNP